MKRKNKPGRRVQVLLFFLGILFFIPNTVLGQQSIAGQAEKKVEKTIQVRQQTQEDRVEWEQKKSKLVFLYEQLLDQKQILEQESIDLAAREKAQIRLNQALLEEKKESLRIQKELMPFLKGICKRLDTLVAGDPPFLNKERTTRLATLDKTMEDPDITISEKYRKVMETLFIEAEYGSTIEVYQDKVLLETDDVLGNIFRLGRVSLFFLSFDQTSCAVFNPGIKKWQGLPREYLPAIRSAVEIGSKQRPVELLPLPIGRLAVKEGGQ